MVLMTCVRHTTSCAQPRPDLCASHVQCSSRPQNTVQRPWAIDHAIACVLPNDDLCDELNDQLFFAWPFPSAWLSATASAGSSSSSPELSLLSSVMSEAVSFVLWLALLFFTFFQAAAVANNSLVALVVSSCSSSMCASLREFST